MLQYADCKQMFNSAWQWCLFLFVFCPSATFIGDSRPVYPVYYTLQTSDSLIPRMSYVTENVDRELQLDRRLSPKLCFYVDTEKIMTSINSMQLLEMKGKSLVVLCVFYVQTRLRSF